MSAVLHKAVDEWRSAPDFVVHIVLSTIFLVHNYVGPQTLNPHLPLI